MAVSPTLKRTLRLVAGALTHYATEKGWGPNDYWIYYRFNHAWDKLHIIFVSRRLEHEGDFENYASVWKHLEQELAADRDLLRNLGLVVRSAAKAEQGGIYAIGPEFREYWTPSPARP